MKEGLCYVVHPAATDHDWQLIFEILIKPAATAAGFTECVLGSQLGDLGVPTERVVSALTEAELVIVDVTGFQDPMTLYQLGIRHARSNRTILIAQDTADIPTIFQPYHTIIYTTKGLTAPKEFQESFATIIQEIQSNPQEPDNPVLRHIQYIEQELQTMEEIRELRQKLDEQERRLQEREAEPKPAQSQRTPITFKRVS